MTAFATVEELQERLEWTLSEDEQRLAFGTLDDLSNDAMHYGSSAWAGGPETPPQVRSMVLKAAARFLRNPDGYTISRAGDEQVSWTDKGDRNGDASFTDAEIKMLQSLAGRASIVSVPLSTGFTIRPPRYDPEQYVGVVGSTEKPMPWFEDFPW